MRITEKCQQVVGKVLRRVAPRRVPRSQEQVIEQIQGEMREIQVRNRIRAVEAVTAKNNLQQQVNELNRRVANLSAKVLLAEARGDEELALRFRRENETCEKSLSGMEAELLRAQVAVEQIKEATWREEEVVRQKNTEALALQYQWQIVAMQKNMVETMITFTTNPAATQGDRDERCRKLVSDAAKIEAEFESAVKAAEAAVFGLVEEIRHARAQNDRTMERDLKPVLMQEEANLAEIRNAHTNAFDMLRRVERWTGIQTEADKGSRGEIGSVALS